VFSISGALCFALTGNVRVFLASFGYKNRYRSSLFLFA